MVVGTLAGMLASLFLTRKFRPRDIVLDGILAAIGFPLTFGGILLIPWRTTINYHEGGTIVTSTMNHPQHPDLVAYAVAILLPVLHQLYCLKTNVRSD
jgi:H+/Cl- antiporter ClcA